MAQKSSILATKVNILKPKKPKKKKKKYKQDFITIIYYNCYKKSHFANKCSNSSKNQFWSWQIPY